MEKTKRTDKEINESRCVGVAVVATSPQGRAADPRAPPRWLNVHQNAPQHDPLLPGLFHCKGLCKKKFVHPSWRSCTKQFDRRLG